MTASLDSGLFHSLENPFGGSEAGVDFGQGRSDLDLRDSGFLSDVPLGDQTMSIAIRKCRPSDARALSLLGQATMLATYAETVPLDDILQHCEGPHSVATYAEWLGRMDYQIWLAEVEATHAPIGYAVLGPPEVTLDLEETDIELRRIYVLQGFHGGGLGARLLSTVVEAAHEAGFQRLLLSVYSRNENAIGFYIRQGFIQAGTHRFKVGSNDYDDFIMARSL